MANRHLGHNIPITPGRRIVADLMRQSRDVPLVTIRREFAIPGVVAVRASSRPRVSWVALFGKAYALAARRHVHLRRNWINFPYPRTYEHPDSECVVLVEREWGGEEVVLGGKVRAPERISLTEFDQHVRRFRTEPVARISPFRQLLRVARYPGWLRRFVFWSSLHWSGPKRCKRFGTFMISSLGNFEAELLRVPMPLTGYLTYGPIAKDGKVSVCLSFDHRVMDGRHAARALEHMEQVLNTTVLMELRRLTTAEPARPADVPREQTCPRVDELQWA